MRIRDYTIEKSAGECTTIDLKLYVTPDEERGVIEALARGYDGDVEIVAKAHKGVVGVPTAIKSEDLLKILKSHQAELKNKWLMPNDSVTLSAKDFEKEYHTDFKATWTESDWNPGGIYMDNKRIPFNKEGNTMNNKDMTPHTSRVEGTRTEETLHVAGRGISGQLLVRDDDAELRLEVPGVPLNRIEVNRIENRLRIRVFDEQREATDFATMQVNTRQLDVYLDESEEIEEVKLSLGILTVTIDRGRRVELLTIMSDE